MYDLEERPIRFSKKVLKCFEFEIWKLASLNNLTQHFGILGGVLKEGVRDGKWEVSAVRAV